ncbi:hypothetical protein ANCCAN_05714 [Ancylostoma caninum]|uniref:Uncharacterized protein n=1 Tax=Ancylostoma caninum TaxID=29170 RepID=A0A368GXU4_ANCCA|nr:hypothetical protein ANCCAN_05714 [Ancylostoma caninum]
MTRTAMAKLVGQGRVLAGVARCLQKLPQVRSLDLQNHIYYGLGVNQCYEEKRKAVDLGTSTLTIVGIQAAFETAKTVVGAIIAVRRASANEEKALCSNFSAGWSTFIRNLDLAMSEEDKEEHALAERNVFNTVRKMVKLMYKFRCPDASPRLLSSTPFARRKLHPRIPDRSKRFRKASICTRS